MLILQLRHGFFQKHIKRLSLLKILKRLIISHLPRWLTTSLQNFIWALKTERLSEAGHKLQRLDVTLKCKVYAPAPKRKCPNSSFVSLQDGHFSHYRWGKYIYTGTFLMESSLWNPCTKDILHTTWTRAKTRKSIIQQLNAIESFKTFLRVDGRIYFFNYCHHFIYKHSSTFKIIKKVR